MTQSGSGMTAPRPGGLQKHTEEMLTSEWGLFDMLVTEAAYSQQIFFALPGTEGRPWVLTSLRELVQIFAGVMMPTFPPIPIGEPIVLLSTTFRSGTFNTSFKDDSLGAIDCTYLG